ncbi:hypothetical protein [Bartonella sp. WD12.1]|uniref:hypothetical protein n=1 Tax=Bartonella sp. WD12.1 TaxID=1933903 RepID=UPI001F0AF47E|nr:hypothetical protein [Bartonella sp. WD12.1]
MAIYPFLRNIVEELLLGRFISGLVFANCERETNADENYYIPNDLDDALDMFNVGPQNLDDLPDEVLE